MRRKLLSALTLGLVLATATGCSSSQLPRLGLPTPRDQQGKTVLFIWQSSWIAALAVGALVWGLILWSVIFHRRSRSKVEVPPQFRYNMPLEALFTIVPLIMVMPTASQAGNFFGNISVKIAGNKDNIAAAIARLEKTWKQYLPEVPFEYTFLDEHFEELYKSEQRQGILFTVFSGIAIFIACLGLLGLSAFSISQRLKEIGIRKVLGASTGGIVTLLSLDFLKLVAFAALIAFPIAWFAMHNWLRDFAYRIPIEWWVFAIAGILAATVALVTISIQALKAALANPVKSLRSE